MVSRQRSRLQPRVLRGSRPTAGLPTCHPARLRSRPPPRRGLPDAPQVPGPAAGRDQQARHHRRAPPRRQARSPPSGALPRHAIGGQRDGTAAVRAEPLHRHPPATLQPGRDPARARHRAVHQRPPRLHLRTEEQPDEADGPRRRAAVRERPESEGAALPARALRGALRGGRERDPLLHPPEGQGLVVPALQPWLEPGRGQPAQPGRPQDRVPVARGASPHEPDGHHRELRPVAGREGQEDRQEEAEADLAPLPATRRGAPPSG